MTSCATIHCGLLRIREIIGKIKNITIVTYFRQLQAVILAVQDLASALSNCQIVCLESTKLQPCFT
jgi:hypothetical protein